MKTKDIYFVELTDTFGGEANYSWVTRFKVHANSERGALVKVSKHIGAQGKLRKKYELGDVIRYNITGAAVCLFLSGYIDEAEHYQGVKSL